MRSRFEAYMDGKPLSHVNPKLLILDIQHEIADPNIQVEEIANRNGLKITSERQNGSSVKITFELHLYSIAERQKACQEVVKWAKGTILETNDREGQRLICRCTEFPRIESALGWTESIDMVFTAFEKPFWEEKIETKLNLTGTSAQSDLYVPGNAGKAYVEATVTPKSTMADITLTAGNTSITLTGCGARTANPVTVAYDEKGFLKIKVGSTSILDKRTGSDDLMVECGETSTFSYTASANVDVEFRVRGLWM